MPSSAPRKCRPRSGSEKTRGGRLTGSCTLFVCTARLYTNPAFIVRAVVYRTTGPRRRRRTARVAFNDRRPVTDEDEGHRRPWWNGLDERRATTWRKRRPPKTRRSVVRARFTPWSGEGQEKTDRVRQSSRRIRGPPNGRGVGSFESYCRSPPFCSRSVFFFRTRRPVPIRIVSDGCGCTFVGFTRWTAVAFFRTRLLDARSCSGAFRRRPLEFNNSCSEGLMVLPIFFLPGKRRKDLTRRRGN